MIRRNEAGEVCGKQALQAGDCIGWLEAERCILVWTPGKDANHLQWDSGNNKRSVNILTDINMTRSAAEILTLLADAAGLILSHDAPQEEKPPQPMHTFFILKEQSRQ
ncbi:hypothetical protein K8942_04790 [Candidatus Peribacteria bacterium]|nr:MAG: hypothetical protein K8942_04790 [Candidatus Peribacteria bacterium]